MPMFVKNEDVTIRAEQDGLFLAYNRRYGIPLVMNTNSHRIWELCTTYEDEKSLMAALIDELGESAKYLPYEQISEIAHQHIQLLMSAGLIQNPSPAVTAS